MIKKLILIVVIMVGLFSLLLIGSPVGADNSSTDLALAQKSAQAWVDRSANINTELSDWIGASVDFPQICYNLQDQIDAYLFTVSSKGKSVGNVVVGSSLYDFNVISSGAVPPLSFPSLSTIRSAASTLGVTVTSQTIGQPTQTLFLGIDQLYALYVIQNQKVAINLESGKATLFSDLKVSLPSPSEYQANKMATQGALQISPLYYYYYWELDMIAYPLGACGPCSGTSIGQYYVTRNPGLPFASLMYSQLCNTMYTNNHYPITYPWDYGNGFIQMASMNGYWNFNAFTNYAITASSYWGIVSDINSAFPTALLKTIDQWHWRAIRGYFYDSNNTHGIYCTNSQTGDSNEYLNFDDLGFTYLVTVAIHDR